MLSIIVPRHNDYKLLLNFLNSLQRTLHISHEIIVLCHRVNEVTARIEQYYRRCRFIVFEESDVLAQSAYQIGSQHANYPVLAFIDEHAVISTDWASQAAHLCLQYKKTQKAFMCAYPYQPSTQPSWIEHAWFNLFTDNHPHVNLGSIIMDARSFRQSGGFSEQRITGNESELVKRIKSIDLDIQYKPQLRAHHEGLPKTLKHFFEYQRRQAKADFPFWTRFFYSKITSTLAFFFFHLLGLAGLITLTPSFINIAVCMVLLMILFHTSKKANSPNPIRFMQLMLLSYIYLASRLFAFYDALCEYEHR